MYKLALFINKLGFYLFLMACIFFTISTVIELLPKSANLIGAIMSLIAMMGFYFDSELIKKT